LNAAQRSEVILYLAQCTAVAWQEVGKFIVSGQDVRGFEAGEQQYAWLWPVRLRGMASAGQCVSGVKNFFAHW
jgi:hypothetical protein